MRILYFTRDYTTHDRRFLEALGKTGHRIFYLRLERGSHQLEDRPLPDGVEMVTWAGGQQPFRWRDLPHLFASLRGVLKRVKPDLLQAGPIQTGAFLAALSGFHPLVSTSWGSDLLRDAGRSPGYRWVTRYTLRHSDVLVGDCQPVRQQAIAFGMPDERIVTFPWGVDLTHFTPSPRNDGAKSHSDLNSHNGENSRPFTLLSLRGWEPIYGVDVIARAFVEAARQLDAEPASLHPALRLIMLGNGSQAGLLRRIFLQAGVLDQVVFPGQVSYADLPRYYHNADLYLSASHSDGTSISLLEAMACGLPALVSDIPGNREWVEPGVHGWWFPDGDAHALAEGIVKAVRLRRQLLQMGAATRCLTEQRADWSQNFQELLRAYAMARNAES